MLSRRACLVLGAGLGALVQPLIAVAFWAHWQLNTRPSRRA